MAHTLKGLASTIGAETLSQRLAEMELQLGQSGDLEETQIREAEDLLKAVVSYIDGLDEAAKPAEHPPLAEQDIPGKLESLVALTEAYNVAAVAELDKLLRHPGDHSLFSELQNIRDDLENFDFDAATRSLKKLLEQLGTVQ